MSYTLDSPPPLVLVETIKHSAGQTKEFIRAVTGVDIADVRQVLAQEDDPQNMQTMLRQAQQKSLKYRCSHTAKLMRSPVQAANKKLYEQLDL
jgi:hypothetical protein